MLNRSAERDRAFTEVNRVLGSGWRLALADLIGEQQLPDSITNDADLWAACIGGPAQIASDTSRIEAAGRVPQEVRRNILYEFISVQATNASQTYA